MKCIYCLKEEDKCTFENTDHIIPQSFGRFINNLTLNHVVCDACNQYFGDELELFLARDTFEGMLRAVYKVKISGDFKLHKKRIVIKIKEKGFWKNALMQMEYSEDDDNVFINPITQVGFLKKDTNEFEFFPMGEIPKKEELEKRGFVTKGEKALKLLFKNGERELLEKELRGIRIKLMKGSAEDIPFEYKGQEVQIELKATVDNIIYRGIAKISFNYLAYCKGRDFVLHDDFNDIRNYIRYGKKSEDTFVIIKNEPILKEEAQYGIKITNGHLVTLGWNGSRTSIISMVSLLNKVNYRIILCKRYSGIYSDFSFGHHFDINAKKVKRLLSLPSNLFIPHYKIL